jgi:hypothetical protein
LTELFLALTAVVTTGKSADYVGFLIYVIPLVMIAAAVAVSYWYEAYLGAGIMIVSFGIQHNLDPIRGVYVLPMILVAIAVILAMRVDYEIHADERAARRVPKRSAEGAIGSQPVSQPYGA